MLADDEAAQTVGPPLASADQPIPISVGIFLLDLVALDEASQTFTCTGYLTETWHDPRLAFSAAPGQPPARYYRKQDVWFPILQFDNSASPRTLSSYLMIGKPDGSVQYIEKFTVRLSTNMQLRAFPFDSQDLEIYVHPFSGQVGRIVLSVDPATTGVSTALLHSAAALENRRHNLSDGEWIDAWRRAEFQGEVARGFLNPREQELGVLYVPDFYSTGADGRRLMGCVLDSG